MTSWRDSILQEFVPQVSKLTIVTDPDALLTEEKLTIELRVRGFDIIEFDDPIAFRYAYESKYRSLWDNGTHTDLVVILRFGDTNVERIPFDLLKSGRKLFFSLGELFPNISYPVIECLDRMHLDALYNAQCRYLPDRMGDNASKDFVLRHVFGIAAELITSDVELLRCALRYHYSGIELPGALLNRLLSVLEQNENLKQWPLELLFKDADIFFAFIQERWPIYLQTLTNGASCVCENASDSNLKVPGPVSIPFGHQDIRVYIDNLFLEGKLNPIAVNGVNLNAAPWVRSGLQVSVSDDNKVRTRRLFAALQESIPSFESRHYDWLSYASKYAELLAAHNSDDTGLESNQIQNLSTTINVIFRSWLEKNFAGLINMPPTNPVMVHHIPRAIAREVEANEKKRVALIVIDGLSMEQWCSAKSIIANQDSSLVFKEHAAFAWIPSLTPISRQAIFAGKAPLYFPTSISTTEREPLHWRQFWENYGISKMDISYHKETADTDVHSIIDSQIIPGKTRVFGLVIGIVDRIMHGMQLGMTGMHNQVRQWCRTGYLSTILQQLIEKGFEVWVTADHGNVECKGVGRPSDGVIAETRGERVRIYPSIELQESALQSANSAQKWVPIGIPPGLFPVIADFGCAFTNEGDKIVSHGGAMFEEVIVPFIKIERKKQ